ncbi:pentatricopeptide repeat-containing protein [Tripterygium wilfordii]|uniref:Pentatricopeptide repeat-containing protein n=1 Tax=Tripterygium wilfordii TaxID=458696 RepID=A0A7J7D6Z9_TRIWF|nr:pentatricopeptide repeat-containing protein At4g04370 [Tripterygium wilfordii]KAF5742145.1 pentatricopeptide repeat-containing protein [Tripterygium wilfordii]
MNRLRPSTFTAPTTTPSLRPPPRPIPTFTTKSFNATINRLSSQNAHYQVLTTFLSMLITNTPSDPYTFPSLLKACTSLNLLSFGLSVHQHVVVSGFSSDSYIASSFINFYAKFGLTCNARKVFDNMPERNLVPWTAIIGCYSRAGDADSGFCLYNQMQSQGIQPSSVTLLELLSGVAELSAVRSLHCCTIVRGFESDIVLVNSLLNLYGKCGSIEEAKYLFDSMDQRDIISWNSLILGYSQMGYSREILHLLYRMRIEGVEPNQQTFGSMVSATARQSDLGVGKLVHGQILKSCFEMDSHVETSLVNMYLKCGDIDAAFQIFEQTPEKDVIFWTAMISGLAQSDCADEALVVFSQMLRSRVEPSTDTVASVLAACAQLESLELGATIHGYTLRREISLDIPAQNSLITMYAKCGRLGQGCVVFDTIGKKNLVSWNAIIAGHAQNGHLCKALSIFNEMRITCQRPDSITVVSLLQACASIGALQQGKWIHNFVIRCCLGPCVKVDTALVDMYCKCGDLEMAQKCFDGLSQKDLISWSVIIAGYGCHGKGGRALKLYSEFLQTGMEPNHIIFLSVLSACSHNGLVQEGSNLFQLMTEEFGIKPKLEHRACIVDLLCRARRVEEAYNFYKQNFQEPAVDVLGILLDACRANGNMGLSNIIAEEIFMLRPVDAGNYVQLAHSYASMNRWDGVGEAWTQMRSLGLKKLPGWSSIELHGSMTTFFMNHNSHTQYEQIVSKLITLRWEMRNMETCCKTNQVVGIW